MSSHSENIISCVDDTNWQDYDKLTAEEDFMGMSAAEIYKTIYEKYQHCYGENFIDINTVPYVSANGSVDTFRGLISRFQRDVKSAIGSGDYADIQKARREALYGDADDYDVRAAIIENTLPTVLQTRTCTKPPPKWIAAASAGEYTTC